MSDKKDDKKKGGDKPKGDDKKKGGDKPKDDKKGGDKKGDKKGDDKKGDKKGDDKKGDKKGDDKKGDKKGDDKKKGGDKPKDEKEAKADKKAAKADAGDDKDAAAADTAAAAADGDDKDGKAPAGPMNPTQALKQVLLTSLHNDGLARGLRESVKALDRREAHLCVLSTGCNEPAYTKLITALCAEHQIPLIKVEDSKELGEWVGLCKRNSEQKAVKIVGCSCAVIRSWGEETEARSIIMEQIKNT